MNARSFIFKNRGALLVAPAIALVVFGKPSPASAVAGLALALAGEGLRIWAVGYSGETTRADVVTAPMLVTAGPYAMVRNPLYLANVIMTLGFCVAFAGRLTPALGLGLGAAVLTFVIGVYTIIVPLEEAYLTKTFGQRYERYKQQIPQAVPLRCVVPREERVGTWRPQVIFRAESITLGLFGLMVAAVLLKLGPLASH